eukprot:1754718-Rhodomonas_salina.1
MPGSLHVCGKLQCSGMLKAAAVLQQVKISDKHPHCQYKLYQECGFLYLSLQCRAIRFRVCGTLQWCSGTAHTWSTSPEARGRDSVTCAQRKTRQLPLAMRGRLGGSGREDGVGSAEGGRGGSAA